MQITNTECWPPPLIKFIPFVEDRPLEMFYEGNLWLSQTYCLSIVGSRNATEGGMETAHRIAAHFATLGYTIVSGMAQGIDAAAHEGALSVPGGKTIAILASGLKMSEIRNPALAQKILNHDGLLLSEYPSGQGNAKRYLARDRIIAAMGIVCIPVQAGTPSGTLATVNRACQYNRGIWVPVPLKSESTHPSYAGIHALIKNNRMNLLRGKQDYTALEEVLKRATTTIS
jgi:DNA processing protein